MLKFLSVNLCCIYKYTLKFRYNLDNTNDFILSSQEAQFKSSSKISMPDLQQKQISSTKTQTLT